MKFDYSKLIGKIKEKYPNRNDFAKLIPLSNNSLSKKLNNKVSFNSQEIFTISRILNINNDDIGSYFYDPKVEKIQ